MGTAVVVAVGTAVATASIECVTSLPGRRSFDWLYSHDYIHLKFKHAVMGTHLGCLSRTCVSNFFSF